nr:immunoglobulin heavy chain junction region [Macaca mulatta]MOX93105.1 immunoglobulin heavy chain junction region [Macaca mulatta]MOX93810.1 immunoglobulin heavy chain junction region [Macaca mulatta]MOX94712.1 immunoglobulin heavy chain junction region [Macaca mulatta]MOX95276.1 immunoglobulin heavy chain junction region [Macaca mulatta]
CARDALGSGFDFW